MSKEALERKFHKLGLRRSFDFILHLPLRYEDETVLGSTDTAVPGEPIQIEARVQDARIAFRPRRQLVVHAEGLALRFYNFYGSQLKQFQHAAEQGLRVRAFGELRGGWFGAEMVHPRYRIVREGEPLPDSLTPVYPTTAGLPQRELRERILKALDADPLGDTLGDELRKRYSLSGFAESVRLLHRPRPGVDLEAAWQRMRFDEMLAQQLSMRFSYRARMEKKAPALKGNGPLLKAFFERLPFKLTKSQSRTAGEVLKDLAEPHPMHRLLQGDVGSGKTVVAAIASLAAVDAGWQAVVMAPTEILSEQHYRKFSEWLAPLGVTIGWLRGGLRKKEKASAAVAQIVVGTHALIEKDVEFQRLGLAVIDEQHRFGVDQRLKLGRIGNRRRARTFPHQLMMSATPIPRTLEMTAYGDLDLSSITELPPGRRPVATRLFSEAKRGEVLQRVRAACADGQQAYWVCPVIEESKEGVQTAIETYERLRTELPGLRVGLLHGRLPAEEKAQVMQAFVSGATQLLVCTTVIEVGVDVPNASLMVIESAERFGLAQLHQLRGRIGRGTRESVCILLYGNELTDTARARLKVIYESNDGFAIAQRDLEIRGPGEFLGERQSGERVLRYADVFDLDLVRRAREAAEAIPETDARAHVDRWYGSKRDLLDA